LPRRPLHLILVFGLLAFKIPSKEKKMKPLVAKPYLNFEVSDREGVLFVLKLYPGPDGSTISAFSPSLKLDPWKAEYMAWIFALAMHCGFQDLGIENKEFKDLYDFADVFTLELTKPV